MDDILTPRERHDAVVLVGVDEGDNVEFVKIYAIDEETARKTLEEFFSARGLFPADYRLVSRGTENVEGKGAITTRTETLLSSSLARLGLKLLSNGVLYLGDAKTVYQLTLVSESLYRKIANEEVEEPEPLATRGLSLEEVLSLGVDVLVENLRGIDIGGLIPPGARLLREPEPGDLVRILRDPERDYPLIVETANAGRYSAIGFSVTFRLPPLSAEEFAAELSSRLGFPVDPGLFREFPPEKLNLWNVEALAKLVEKLEKRGLPLEEALGLAVELNLGRH
ncbi:hypothetical protein [Thermococcus waiotapuensis]|uniref:Uncharacterized protein n=1 Tax=Thermococcus waiotapuensis TaxID=90909 RepID=A0AAE4NUG2_9EURY|nr:hypothetical protein [Thermococcus waiotapuensis]MDV3103038.1 hypothetical protein [Thermococcus waiotapuensis]